MKKTQTTHSIPTQNAKSIEEPAYEAPAIEAVVTLDSLEREIFYAGSTAISGGNNSCQVL